MTDCDLSGHVLGWPEFDALALAAIDATALLEFYDRFGFQDLRSASSKVAAGADAPPPSGGDERPAAARRAEAAPAETIEALRNNPDLGAARRLDREDRGGAELTALDTETDSLDAIRAQLVGISLSVAPGEAAYIPLRHGYAGAPDQLAVEIVLARLKPWLENPAAAKLGQNIKYDTHVFANAGIAVRGYAHDTMLQSYVLEAHKPHSLESLAERHLGRKGLTYEDLCGKGANQIPFAQVDIERAATTRARTARWRCTCTRRCGRRSRPRPACSTSTGASRCRPRRCSAGSSAPAC